MRACLNLLIAITLLAEMVVLPVIAASPTKTVPAAGGKSAKATNKKKSRWPHWYLLDRYGLQAWNKGDRPLAKKYWERALGNAEATVPAQARRGLDPVTERMVSDMIKHLGFLVTYWETPKPQSNAHLTPKQAMVKYNVAKIEDIDRKIKYLERLQRFSKNALGAGHFQTKEMDRLYTQLRNTQLINKSDVEHMKSQAPGSYDTGRRMTGPKRGYLDRKGTVLAPEWVARSKYEKRDVHGEKKISGSSNDMPTWYRNKLNRTARYVPGVRYQGGKKLPAPGTVSARNGQAEVQGVSQRGWGQSPDRGKRPVPRKWGQAEERAVNDPNRYRKPKSLWGQAKYRKNTENTGWGNAGWTGEQKNRGKVRRNDGRRPDNRGQIQWR